MRGSRFDLDDAARLEIEAWHSELDELARRIEAMEMMIKNAKQRGTK